MKKEDLFDIVTDIDEKKILDANPATYKGNVVEMPKKVKARNKFIRYSSIAVAACLILAIGFTVPKIMDKGAEEIIKGNQGQEQVIKSNQGQEQIAANLEQNQGNDEDNNVSGKQKSESEASGGKTNPVGEPNIESAGSISEPIIEQSGAPLKNNACVSAFFGLTQWENKTVETELVDQLKAADPNEQFEIIALPYVDYDFIYQGKTLGEYYRVMANNNIMPEILGQLLKEGDSLKYGEALYETGDKDGVKWDKGFYEERIRFYGEDLLAKYIVDGEFLADKVEEDREAVQAAIKESTKAYKACWHAYMDSIGKSFPKLNQAEVKGDYFILHMTKDEFAAFMPEHVEAWTFRTNTSSDDGKTIPATK